MAAAAVSAPPQVSSMMEMSTAAASSSSSSAASSSRYQPSKEEVAEQWLFTEEDIEYTPTVLAGILKPAEERKARRRGVGLIYKVAERSQLHSHVLHTAALFFHRFFFRRIMRPPGFPSLYAGQRTYVYQDIAIAALYLASKVEEGYRKLDDIVSIACQVEPGRVGSGLEEGESEEAVLKNGVLAGEEILLATLCFDLIVEHPQKQLIVAARKLGVEIELLRCAYANMHDAFRDPICTFFEAPVLAAGVFALACEDAEVDPTTYMAASEDISSMVALTWLETFDVAEDEVEACLTALRSVRASLQISEPRPASSTIGTPRTVPATPYHPSAPASSGHLTPFASTTTNATPHQPDQTPPVLPPPPLERLSADPSGGGEARPPTRHGAPASSSSAVGGGRTFSRSPLAPPHQRQQPASEKAAPAAPAAQVPVPVPSAASAAEPAKAYVPLSPSFDEPYQAIGNKEEKSATPDASDSSAPAGQSEQPKPQDAYVPLSPPTYEEPVQAAPGMGEEKGHEQVQQEAREKIRLEQEEMEEGEL